MTVNKLRKKGRIYSRYSYGLKIKDIILAFIITLIISVIQELHS